jgi:hypothetical protein
MKSVEGVKIITAPSKGTGEEGDTTAVVELTGKASLGKLISAIEECKTPHAAKMPPGVTAATTMRFKPGTTHAQIVEALKKAGLLEE